MENRVICAEYTKKLMPKARVNTRSSTNTAARGCGRITLAARNTSKTIPSAPPKRMEYRN